MSHPEIGSLVRKRDLVHTQLYDDYQPEKAIEGMQGIYFELEEKHQSLKEDFNDRIENELKYLDSLYNTSRGNYKTTVLNKKGVYKRWLQELNQLLWEGNYLINEKYDNSGLDIFREDDDWEPA